MNNDATVYDYMTGDLPDVFETTPLNKVIELLDKYNFSGLPVVNAQHQLIGIISEKDCIHQLIQSSYHCESPPNTHEVMTKEAQSVKHTTSIYQVADIMDKRTLKALPVLKDEKVVGLITRAGVLRALNDYLMTCSLPSNQ